MDISKNNKNKIKIKKKKFERRSKQTLTQIPHPIQSSSEREAIFERGVTSIQSFPIRTTGQDFLHSCRHLFGLHLSSLTIAIRVCLSVSSKALLRDILK